MKAAVFNPLTFIIACVCIPWLELGSVGPFSVKLPYLLLSLGIVYAASSADRMAACLQFVRQNALWIAPFAIYLVLLSIVLFGSDGQNMPLRQLFFLLGGIAVAGSLAVTRNLAFIVRAGAAMAIALLIIVVEILARTIGLSWVDAIVEFIVNGDRKFVAYQFFRGVFNAIDPNADALVSAGRKNGIAVGVLTAALLFRSGSARASWDLVGMAVFGLALLLLLLLNTRSVLIVAGASILLVTAINAVTRPQQLSILMLKGLAALVVIMLAFGYTDVETPTAGTMGERFAFEDQSTAERVGQYQAAFERISQHPLTGSGYSEITGQPIHNLFLSAWMHAGLAAFILVVVFYVALLAHWLSVLRTYISHPDRWVIPIAFEWIAPLPILPLFRVWLAGDGGHLFLGEWVALTAFLGIVLANDLKLRRTTARRVVRVVPRPIESDAVGSAA